jgi:hypothetical protein
MGGRPRGYDFRKIAEERAQKLGQTMEEAIGDVYEALKDTSKGKDAAGVAAGKVLLERLCDPVAQRVAIGGDPDAPPIQVSPGPAIPETAHLIRDIKILGRLGDELLPKDGGET